MELYCQRCGLWYEPVAWKNDPRRIEASRVHGGLRLGIKPERNDPCPCGSGKKFKKCCLK